MKHRYSKRKEPKTWRVVPARITPKRKEPGDVPRILRAYAIAHTGTAPASGSSTLIETLNHYLGGTSWQVTPELVKTWEQGFTPPDDDLLNALARHAPPLSWPWLLAHDLLAASHPHSRQPQGTIGRRILSP